MVVVGASSSGEDISRELATCARQVYLCARSWQNPQWGFDTAPVGERANLHRRPTVRVLRADGRVEFDDGSVTPEAVDHVVYCTGAHAAFARHLSARWGWLDAGALACMPGCQEPMWSMIGESLRGSLVTGARLHDCPTAGYEYRFPFLESDPATAAPGTVDDNRVAPLFEDIFVPQLGPFLSFIGLPWKVVPFPQFQVQARLVARALSGRAVLPSADEMQRRTEERYRALEAEGRPRRHTHMQGDGQWDYNNRLLRMCGGTEAPLPRCVVRMAAAGLRVCPGSLGVLRSHRMRSLTRPLAERRCVFASTMSRHSVQCMQCMSFNGVYGAGMRRRDKQDRTQDMTHVDTCAWLQLAICHVQSHGGEQA